jgi:hypothetical protein
MPDAREDEQATIDRVVERLRRDHPDPELREQLYAEGKLAAYVRVLVADADDAELATIAAAVRAAEDGTPGPMTSDGEKS